MSSRSNMIKAKGLKTFGSEISISEGALKVAENINIDESGVVTPRRGFNDCGNALPLADDRLKQLMQYKGKIIRHFNSTLQFETDSETFSTFEGDYSELESGIRIKSQESNSNLYFTTNTGIKKISATSSSEFSTATGYISNAGAVKAVDMSAKVLLNDSGYLPAQSKVAYRVLFGYKDKNNNLILGAPSARYVLTNSSADINLNEQSSISITGTTVLNIDYVMIATVEGSYFLWFKDAPSDTAPSTVELAGKAPLEVDIQGVPDSMGIASRIVTSITTNAAKITAKIDPNNDSKVLIETTDPGDTEDIDIGSTGSFGSDITVAREANGGITAGQAANAEITFTIPSEVSTDLGYFYQVYRSSVVTTSVGLELNDLEPEDEMNLVLEATIGEGLDEITTEDITPDSFRSAGLPLYTNPISGQGILKANEQPPISKDIALFNSHMFYSNTKTKQRQQFTILSVDDFTSNSTELIIGNKDIARSYTFIGSRETTPITVDNRTNTVAGGYVDLNSSSNEREYRVWFSTVGGDPAPASGDRLLVRVALENYADSVAGTIEALTDAFAKLDDFDLVDIGTGVEITNTNNGVSVDASMTNLADLWAIGTITQGTGEDASVNQVLLSGLVSVGQSIDETSRSLVRIINKDSQSAVNAYYLSGEGDLPGNILLENRSVEDVEFYVATNDLAIQEEFNPALPLLEDIEDITFENGSSGDNAKITVTGHGLVTGSKTYISSPDTTPSFTGNFSVTVLDVDNFVIEQEITGEDTPSADAFFWVSSTYESTNDESSNRLYYSKLGQPESVPLLNYLSLGPKDQPIERIVALRDYLIVLKSDGVYLVSGNNENFSSRLLDDTARILAPDSAANLNNQIFCLTNQGITTITDGGASVISRSIENLILDATLDGSQYRTASFGVSYENDRAYLLWLPTELTDTVGTQAFRYNIFERSWTKWTKEATCGLVKQADDKMYLGDATRNYLLKERKNRDRTDHADRDFSNIIGFEGVEDTIVRLSNLTDIEVGDVLFQETYLTITQFNQFLIKLDLDKAAELVVAYEDTFRAIPGVNIQSAFQAVNTSLVSELGITAITPSFSIEEQKDQWNSMMEELNLAGTPTRSKNYPLLTKLIPYESIITSIDTRLLTVTLAFAIPVIQGDVTIFKGINSVIQWQPQHYGDPSALKQIREATIIFDQNNFYSAYISFASDASSSLVGADIRGKGIAYWGYGDWNDSNNYWGGEGNDIPLRRIVPTDKQRCRYLTTRFEHINAREDWRILGITAVVRALSSRAYR